MRFVAQNGTVAQLRPKIATSCKPKKGAKGGKRAVSLDLTVIVGPRSTAGVRPGRLVLGKATG